MKSGITLIGWHVLLYVLIFISLLLIPILDLYYLFPDHGIDFYVMPKLNKFFDTYSLNEIQKYNTIVWNTLILWIAMVVLNFYIAQILHGIETKDNGLNKRSDKYLKKVFYASLAPIALSLIFIFSDIQVLRSGANDIDYVNLRLIEDYVYRQCRLFYTFQLIFSPIFLLFATNDGDLGLDNRTIRNELPDVER